MYNTSANQLCLAENVGLFDQFRDSLKLATSLKIQDMTGLSLRQAGFAHPPVRSWGRLREAKAMLISDFPKGDTLKDAIKEAEK